RQIAGLKGTPLAWGRDLWTVLLFAARARSAIAGEACDLVHGAGGKRKFFASLGELPAYESQRNRPGKRRGIAGAGNFPGLRSFPKQFLSWLWRVGGFDEQARQLPVHVAATARPLHKLLAPCTALGGAPGVH